MPTTSESRQVESMVSRLAPFYSSLDEQEIREIATAAIRALDGARLRQFVPLLAERDAKNACRERHHVRQGSQHMPAADRRTDRP